MSERRKGTEEAAARAMSLDLTTVPNPHDDSSILPDNAEVERRRKAAEQAYADQVSEIVSRIPGEVGQGILDSLTLAGRGVHDLVDGAMRGGAQMLYDVDHLAGGPKVEVPSGQKWVREGEAERTVPIVNIPFLAEDLHEVGRPGSQWDSIMDSAEGLGWNDQLELDRARNQAEMDAAKVLTTLGFAASLAEALAIVKGIGGVALPDKPKTDVPDYRRTPEPDVPADRPADKPKIEMPAPPPPSEAPMLTRTKVSPEVRAQLVDRLRQAQRAGDAEAEARVTGAWAALDGMEADAIEPFLGSTPLKRAFLEGVSEGHRLKGSSE